MEALLSLFAGGATGIIGSLFGKVFGFAERWQQNSHELKLMELQEKYREADHEREVRIIDMNTSADLRKASYEHDSATGQASLWVVNILRLVRPVLTACLVGSAIYIAIYLQLPAEMDAIGTILYLATTAVTWWFGDRAKR